MDIPTVGQIHSTQSKNSQRRRKEILKRIEPVIEKIVKECQPIWETTERTANSVQITHLTGEEFEVLQQQFRSQGWTITSISASRSSNIMTVTADWSGTGVT